jgi:hypothetical protein
MSKRMIISRYYRIGGGRSPKQTAALSVMVSVPATTTIIVDIGGDEPVLNIL